MPQKTPLPKLFALLCLCGLLLPGMVLAQTGQSHLHVNDVKPPEQVSSTAGVPGLSLDVTFTMLDASENVLLGKEIESATYTISNGTYPAIVQGIGTPWTVVLLIDGSSTMANFKASAAFKNAKTALANSLGQGQQSITFAILKFDDRAPTQLEFSQDQEKIKKTITDMRATQSGNSCLHNGAFEAVNKLSGAPGRRAVIIFSASIDNCSQRTAADVVNLATQNNVEVYAVGLKGYTVTEAALDDLTVPTGGLAVLQEEGELGFAFQNVMSVLASQFQAKATLFPPAGKQTAELSVTLKDQTVLTAAPIEFESPQDFIPPPEIHIKGQVLPRNDGITFNLDIINPDKIEELRVNIVSKLTGLSVYSQTLSEFGETNNVLVGNLDIGGEYQLFIAAVDDRGVQLSETAAEFKFEPPPVQFAVSNFEMATLEKPQFTLAVEPATPEGVFKFELVLIDASESAPVPGVTQSYPVGEALILPVTDAVVAGEYAILVRGLDSTGKVLAEAQTAKFNYAPPSWLDRVVLWVQSSPLAIGGLGALCCAAVLGLVALVGGAVASSRRSKVKEVDIFVPEKRVQQARPMSDSGVFESQRPPEPPPPPPPPRRREPAPERAPVGPPQPSVDLPLASLTGHTPATALPRMEIRKATLTVGRRSGNDVTLNVDASSGVSGTHCRIMYANGRYYVQDDGSSYGTTVNGQKADKGRPTALDDGAVIGLGPKIKIQFHLGK